MSYNCLVLPLAGHTVCFPGVCESRGMGVEGLRERKLYWKAENILEQSPFEVCSASHSKCSQSSSTFIMYI